jgi:hypothetical protein
MMITDDNSTEKKRQKKLKSFLSNGKLHFLNSMGYQPTSTTKKGTQNNITSNSAFFLYEKNLFIIVCQK